MKIDLMKLGAVVLVSGVVACGGGQGADDVSTDGLSTTTKSYVSVRRDARKCPAPGCGGWFVQDLNGSGAEQYVTSLDFSAAGLDSATIDRVQENGADVVLYGKLGAADAKTKLRDFKASTAWRGLPGVKAASGDIFFTAAEQKVTCATAPCFDKKASRLNKTTTAGFSSYDLGAALKPYVDGEWLTSLVNTQGAIVAGQLVDGAKMAAGTDKVLAATQIFMKLPEQAPSCIKSWVPRCDNADEVVIYARDENRCVNAVGCAKPGVCSDLVPTCDQGYQLVQWTAGANACNAFACDPQFSL
jgi:hypothetical protein